jgi:hypothetical protein
MAERAQRRTNASDAPAIDLRHASRDLAAFAARLGRRVDTVDDGLAIATILTSARRVAALVESRGIAEAAPERAVQRVDLGESLRRVLDVNRMAFTARGVALTTEPAPGVVARVDELALDVTLSVLCCWAVLRAAPGSEVHAAVHAIAGAPTVRFCLGVGAPEDGCVRIARSLAVAIGARLELDDGRGTVEVVLPAG